MSLSVDPNKPAVKTSLENSFVPVNSGEEQGQVLKDTHADQPISPTAAAEKQIVNAGDIRQNAFLNQQLSPSGFDYNAIQGLENNPNVTPEFIREVEAMSARLGARPEHILSAMSFETGGTFSPSIQNGIGATGLIQFIPSTARGLGTSTDALRQMSPTQQMEFVEKYFQPFKGKLDSLEKVYTSILAGSPKNSPDDVLFRRGTRAYAQNPLDWNRDGKITAQEATTPVNARMFGGIEAVQQKLLDGNHVRINDRPGFADGLWGRKTATALANFQEANGLPRTGNLDEATGRRLFGFPDTPPTLPPVDPPSTGPIPNTGLEKGNRGGEVEKLQDILIRLGEMTEAQKATGPGIFGPRTEASLKDFQRNVGVNETGKFDNATHEAIEKVLGGIRKGERGEMVDQMQDRLVELGFMTAQQKATGPGIFGPQTDAALRSFQRQNGLAVDGIMGPNTYNKLQGNSTPAPGGGTVSPNTNLYSASSGVEITPELAPRLDQVAAEYLRRTGQKLHVTSGYRSPARQASAMAGLIQRNGQNYVRNLYANKTAVNEILNAYNRGGVAEMTRTLESQVARGTFISNHMRNNAIDVRISANKTVLTDIVNQFGGNLLDEGDHYHLRLG